MNAKDQFQSQINRLLEIQKTGLQMIVPGALLCGVVFAPVCQKPERFSWPAAAVLSIFILCAVIIYSIYIYLPFASQVLHIRSYLETENSSRWKEYQRKLNLFSRFRFRIVTSRFTLPSAYTIIVVLSLAASRLLCTHAVPTITSYAALSGMILLALLLIATLVRLSYYGTPRLKAGISPSEGGNTVDIDLPLWNKDETDVLPEYRLTFGHVICQAAMTPEEVKLLGEYLRIGSIEYAGNFDVERLRVISGHLVLGTEQETHLLIAEVDDHHVIFAPHRLFYSSQYWIDWNKDKGGLMAYVTQNDVTDFFYIIFRDGQRLMDACAEGYSLRYIEDTPIEVFLGGERIYYDPGGRPQPTDEIDTLLASDARIINEDGVISIRTFPSNQPVRNLTHYIFRCSSC